MAQTVTSGFQTHQPLSNPLSSSRANNGNRKNQTSSNFFPASSTPQPKAPLFTSGAFGNNVTSGPYAFYATPRTSY